jgi:hypothetical protein
MRADLTTTNNNNDATTRYHNFTLLASPDGVHWASRVAASGPISDRSTIFFNPFRGRWVFSIKRVLYDPRQPSQQQQQQQQQLGRSRVYREGTDLWEAAQWGPGDPVNWTSADNADPPVGCGAGQGGDGFTQLYNLDAVACVCARACGCAVCARVCACV